MAHKLYKVQEYLDWYPDWAKSAVVVMSGGMDSAIAARLTVEKYGADNVHALSFFYGQKQSKEIGLAKENAKKLGLAGHKTIDISFLGDVVRGVSANIVGGLETPDADSVSHDDQPVTYVPNRNAILLMTAASYAEANDLDLIVTGVQTQDEYGYWDCTDDFIVRMNDVLCLNRRKKIAVYAPFLYLGKATEIEILQELDGNIDLLKNTLTCYNPSENISCGVCPSCADRINNFKKLGLRDPIEYAVKIDWEKK